MQQLRIKRAATPEPPYWFATAIAPYSSRRAQPVAIDYLDLEASSAERFEVSVCDDVHNALERVTERQPLSEPVLIEATQTAERIFRRGADALHFCTESRAAAMLLVSSRGALPEERPPDDSVVAIAAWPLEIEKLERLFEDARQRQFRWGVAAPVVYPVTTDLRALARLAELARFYGAEFFAAIPLELDPTAKQAVARSLRLDSGDEVYTMLFHADLEPIHVATERHIAALAASHGMVDFIIPPRWGERSNWNAAVLLTLTASRMIAMSEETELAGALARSARVVAELDKPLERIAAAANLSIIEALDEVTVGVLAEWLEGGRAAFVDRVNERWRLRRDAGMVDE